MDQPVQRAAATPLDLDGLIDGQRFGRFQCLVLSVLSLVALIEGFNNQMNGLAAPALLHELHVSKSVFGVVFSLALVGYMVGALTLTSLADRVGRRGVLIGGVTLFGLASLATMVAHSLATLIVARAIAGLGLGASVPTAVALVAELSAARIRATVICVIFVGYNLGGALAGLVASLVIPRYGWPSIFLIGGAVALVIAAILWAAVPEAPQILARTEAGRRQLPGLLARMRPDQPLAGPIAGPLAGGEARARAGGLPVAKLLGPGYLLATILLWIAVVANFTAHFFITSWLPTIVHASGLDIAVASRAGGLFQAGGVIGSLLVGRMLDRLGIRGVALCLLLSIPAIAVLGWVTGAVLLLYVLCLLMGVFQLGGTVGLNALSGVLYPTEMRATGSGWAFGVGRLGGMIGPLLGGILMTAGMGPDLLFTLAAIPVVLATACVFLLARTARIEGGDRLRIAH